MINKAMRFFTHFMKSMAFTLIAATGDVLCFSHSLITYSIYVSPYFLVATKHLFLLYHHEIFRSTVKPLIEGAVNTET